MRPNYSFYSTSLCNFLSDDMAVDSKYADLPGIDTQPDVYESSDVAPMNVPAQNDLGSDCVEALPVDTKKSYSIFKDKYLDPRGADFSDRLGVHRSTGYEAGEFCSASCREHPETPLEKFERLQRELHELASEVQDVKASTTGEGASAAPSTADLAEKVSSLQSHLQSLQTDTFGTIRERPGPALQADLSKKLMSQVEAFGSHSTSSAAGGDAGRVQEGSADCMTYELFYQPAQAEFSGVSKSSELEHRISQLEKLLGKDSRVLSSITGGVAGASGDLLSSMSVLQAKMALLDPGHAEAMNGRLVTLLHNLKQLQQSKVAEDEAKKTKVAELYDMVGRWDTVAVTIPDLIARFKSLKALHEQAAHFSNTLRDVDVGQQQINSRLEGQAKVLKELEESFRANMEGIQSNCQSLENRIQQLMEGSKPK